MADSTLDSELFVLYDNWPGTARVLGSGQVPNSSFTSTVSHNVATAKYSPGEKVSVWNQNADAGQEGMSTFIYLQVLTQNADVAIAAKTVCVPGSATKYYQVGNNPDADVVLATGAGLIAVAISAITNAYWGWFWCGGICPEGHVSGLGGNYLTQGAVAAGAIIVSDLAADALGFGPCAADTSEVVGFALADDAA